MVLLCLFLEVREGIGISMHIFWRSGEAVVLACLFFRRIEGRGCWIAQLNLTWLCNCGGSDPPEARFRQKLTVLN